MNTKVIEIYDLESNDTIMSFVSKQKNTQKEVIKKLESVGFKLFLQGSITPNGNNIYWTASNDDYKGLHLKYREHNYGSKEIYITQEYSKNINMLKPVDVICYNDITHFARRITAMNFYENCMINSEGSERERYTNVYLSLKNSTNKLVCDEIDLYEEPMIYSVKKFNGHHLEKLEDLPTAMSYQDYLEYQNSKEKQDLEIGGL